MAWMLVEARAWVFGCQCCSVCLCPSMPAYHVYTAHLAPTVPTPTP